MQQTLKTHDANWPYRANVSCRRLPAPDQQDPATVVGEAPAPVRLLGTNSVRMVRTDDAKRSRLTARPGFEGAAQGRRRPERR